MDKPSPLKGSTPPGTNWGARSVFAPQDAAQYPNPFTVPMPSLGAPANTPQVDPLSGGRGTDAQPRDYMGSVGVGAENPLLPKTFGSPADPRAYPPEGFSKPQPGPGTALKDNDDALFQYAKMGTSTTVTPGFPRLSKSGTGLRDQSREHYHPIVSTGTIGQKRRFFK